MRKITMKSTSENGGSVRDKSEDRATNFSDQDDDNKHDATEKDANKSFDTDKSFVDSENEKQSDLENDNNSDADETQTGKSKSKKSPKKRTKKNAGNAAAVNGKAAAKKKPKKKKGATDRKSNAVDGEETEEEYEVDKVVDKKKVGSKIYYLIRWKGYTSSDDTWEAENTLNCDALIKEYLEKAKKEPPQSKKRGTEAPRRTQRVDYTEDEEEEEYSGYQSSTRKRKVPAPPAKGKRARKDEESDDDEPPEEYEVEKILKVQSTKKGREFLVRWKGYPESQATWEPENNLNCRDLLDGFLEKQKENSSPKKTKPAPKNKKKSPKSPKGRAGRAKAR